MAKPDYLHLTAFVLTVGGLLGLVASGTALLGDPVLLEPGVLRWPGWDLPLTLASFVGSIVGLATVVGLLTLKPWAPKAGAVLGVLVVLAGTAAITLMPALHEFVFPALEMVAWSVAIVAGIWVVIFCTSDAVVLAVAEEEVFPTTRPEGHPEVSEAE